MQAVFTRPSTTNAAHPAAAVDGTVAADAPADEGTRVWKLQRNCSLTPGHTACAFALVAAVSLAVALGFAMAGVGVVMIFTGIELLALGAAWLWWGRHASDGEVVVLTSQQVHVQSFCASRTDQQALPRTWLRVQRDAQGLWLQSHGQRVRVGLQASPVRLRAFESELREALRAPAPLSLNQI